MTLRADINAIRDGLKSALNQSPLNEVKFTDNYKPSNFPGAYFIMGEGVPNTEEDLFRDDFRAWQLSVDIFIYTQRDHASAVDTVNEVYDNLASQTNLRLGGTCTDYEIDGYAYGRVALGEDAAYGEYNGGNITITIKFNEQR